MGQCGCSSENNFFKVGDKLLVMENWDDCPDCGGKFIQLSILTDDNLHCFDELEEKSVPIKKLTTWMNRNPKSKEEEEIMITAKDFSSVILRKLDESLECAWDEIYPEFEKLKNPEKLLTKFDKLLKTLLERKLGEA